MFNYLLNVGVTLLTTVSLTDIISKMTTIAEQDPQHIDLADVCDNLEAYLTIVDSEDPTFIPGLSVPVAIAIDIMMGTLNFTRRMLADQPDWIDHPMVVFIICNLFGELQENLYPSIAAFLSLRSNPALLSELYWLVATFGARNNNDSIMTYDILRAYGVPFPENFEHDLAVEASRPFRNPATYVIHAHINHTRTH